jgi:glycosyltransferase involved in cell wall biosynthesis
LEERMRVAIFDYRVIHNNPIGSCHLKLVEGLSREHEFVVFSPQFENPDPERICHVRIRVPLRPQLLLSLSFLALAPLYSLAFRLRHRVRFDVVQAVESNFLLPKLIHAQFCHRAFLRLPESRPRSLTLRRCLRWTDHWLHAVLEPWVYRRARRVVAPSEGLRRELETEYPATRGKVTIIHNPIAGAFCAPPATFDRQRFWRQRGVDAGRLILVFVALGHFDRKGLPRIVTALSKCNRANLQVVVVGGDEGALEPYRTMAMQAGVSNRIHFQGFQADVRPFFWAADGFVHPSSYEACPLVCLEAATAGLPLIVTQLHGVEDFARDGINAFVVDRTDESLAEAFARFADLSAEDRQSMGRQAARSVAKYSLSSFVEHWRATYARWNVA